MPKISTKAIAVDAGYECNNFCVFCMQTDRAKRFAKNKKFSDEKIYEVLAAGAKAEKIIFTGAEPTLNPQLADYVRRAKESGYKRIQIISNGRLLNYKKYCTELIGAGANEFTISIHGHNRATHEAITRAPGSFEQARAGLANLSQIRREQPIRLAINHVLVKNNFKSIPEFLKFLRGFFLDDAVLKIVSNMRERTGKEKSFSLMPRYSEVAGILEETRRQNEEPFLSRLNGSNYVYVYDLPFCCYRQAEPFLGVREKTFWEKGGEGEMIDHSRNKIKRKECRDCGYNSLCGGVYKSYIAKYGWDEFVPVRR